MNRKQLLIDLNKYLEKSAGREHLTGSITKFLIWFFENSTAHETEKYSFDEFAEQIILAMNVFRNSNIDQVAEYRREFLDNSQLIKVTSIPALCELPNDKQRDAFAAILRLVICNAIYSAEFTYWPFLGFRIKAAETQLSNAVSLFTAQVWENGLREIALDNPDKVKVCEIGLLIKFRVSKITEDGVVTVELGEQGFDLEFEIKEKFKLPKIKLAHTTLAIALGGFDRLIGFWTLSRETPEILRITVR